MNMEKSVGRTVGVLLLLHFATGLMIPFILIHPLVTPPGFLVSAAGVPNQTRAAVMLFFVGSALPIAVACAGLRFFREYSSAMAYWLLALAVTGFSLQAVDNAHLLSELTLSQAYAAADASQAQAFQTVALAVGAARKWSHYSALLAVGCWIFLFFGLLYRFRLAPRAWAAFGLLAALSQIGGVTLRGLWGYQPEMRMAMPLAPAYAGLALWLIFKGFSERRRPLEAQVRGAEAAD